MSDTTTLLHPASRTLICSVLFLDIVEYSKKSVSGQIRLKDRFNTLLSQAIAHIEATDRIILDTGDGAAISFLGDPEEALIVALSLRTALLAESDPELPLLVRIGINLGPVKLVKDINGQPNIIGDGINVAQRVMSFAEPGQVLISRSYYDVVSRMSQEYGGMFQYLGSHTDKHVREHEIYAFVPPEKNLGSTTAKTAAQFSATQSGTAARPAAAWFSLIWQNKTLAYIVGGVAVLLIVIFSLIPSGEQKQSELVAQAPAEGEAGSSATSPSAPPAKSSAAAKKSTPRGSSKGRPLPSIAPSESTAVSAQPERSAEAAPALAAASAAPAYIGFAITPWGEIFLDGKYQGVSPPVKEIPVTPGRHQILIKNTTFPPYQDTIALKPNGRVKIKHKFSQ